MSTREDRQQRAKDLIAEIDSELRQRQDPKTVLEQMRKSALAALLDELNMLSRLLGITRHRLVFIGQVGVGKTTVICHLAGLTAERDKKKRSSRTGSEKVPSHLLSLSRVA